MLKWSQHELRRSMAEQPTRVDEPEATLEAPDTIVESGDVEARNSQTPPSVKANSAVLSSTPITTETSAKAKSVKISWWRRFRNFFNIYILIFSVIFAAGLVIVIFSLQKARRDAQKENATITTQSLDQATLDALRNTEAKIGDPKQILTVEANAVFAGKVLIRDSIEVAGTIKAGGSLTLPGITVSGAANFDKVQINNLAISGNTSVQGTLTIQRNLSVTGGASFGDTISAPRINIDTITINKDLGFNRHLDAGGSSPTIAIGTAVGSGGTVSISGTDTAGTVNINTGTGTTAGVLATIKFAVAFAQTPHVVITPVGSAGAATQYYVTRTATGFTIATVNAAPASSTVTFDYIIID